jgi:signal transduction histidine kinase
LRYRLALSTHNRPLLIFVLAILFPSLALVLTGLSMIRQERLAAEVQVRAGLEQVVERAALALSHEIEGWQRGIDGIPVLTAIDPSQFPVAIKEAIGIPGAAAVISVEPDRIRVFPPQQMLYAIDGDDLDCLSPPPALSAAEEIELRSGDYARALELYRGMLSTNRDRAVRPWIVQRIARVAQKAGRREEALKAYAELKQSSDAMLGSVPAPVVADYELCILFDEAGSSQELTRSAFGLYRALTAGDSLLQRERYIYYSGAAQRWLAGSAASSEAVRECQRMEEGKRTLTQAIESLAESWRSGGRARSALPAALPSGPAEHLAFWSSIPSGRSRLVLLLSANYLSAQVWPRVFSQAPEAGTELVVSGADGEIDFSSSPARLPAQIKASLSAGRVLRTHDYSWKIDAWPSAPDSVENEIRNRQRVHVAMLGLMLASLVFGVYTSARTLQKQLEVARLKSEFVSGVSHEFRSPLTGIRQLSEMLSSGRVKTEERKARYYLMINREAERLSHLVENALGFARVTEKTARYRYETVNTAAWLKEVVLQFQQSSVARETELISAVPDDLHPIRADREALASAIHNVLDNAVKYSPHCKTVWLDAANQGKYVVIRVRDRGLGISDEDQKRIFERFYRGRDPETRKVHGSGLGLSLVQEVIAAQGGRVNCESRPGEGSTFFISLKILESIGDQESP